MGIASSTNPLQNGINLQEIAVNLQGQQNTVGDVAFQLLPQSPQIAQMPNFNPVKVEGICIDNHNLYVCGLINGLIAITFLLGSSLDLTKGNYSATLYGETGIGVFFTIVTLLCCCCRKKDQ